ncbi:MAG: DUF333 domain-containing protein [Nanoarchaeota archaeon]|nr:DUF333 domain-containing protein [Nanoarchaeota archaeon]
MKTVYLSIVVMISLFLFGCAKEQPAMANPASVYCAEQGGSLDINTNVDGSQTGYCTLSDNTICEEWAYFKGECP